MGIGQRTGIRCERVWSGVNGWVKGRIFLENDEKFRIRMKGLERGHGEEFWTG